MAKKKEHAKFELSFHEPHQCAPTSSQKVKWKENFISYLRFSQWQVLWVDLAPLEVSKEQLNRRC